MTTRRALVVGVAAYEHANWSNLKAPEFDAESVAACLEHPAIGDFEVAVLADPTSAELRDALVDHYKDANRGDVLLFYYSGHGFIDRYNHFHLTTQDTRMDRLATTAVEGAFVRQQSDRSRSRSQIIVLDCCFGAALVEGAKTSVVGSPVNLDDHFAAATSGNGSYVLASAGRTEYAYERSIVDGVHRDGTRSLFTDAFVGGLETGRADLDLDGQITVDELFDYVSTKMRQERDPTRPQTPAKTVTGQEHGPIVLAQSTLKPFDKATTLLRRRDRHSRLAGLDILTGLLESQDQTLTNKVAETLEQVAETCSDHAVSEQARKLLSGHRPETIDPETDSHDVSKSRRIEAVRQSQRRLKSSLETVARSASAENRYSEPRRLTEASVIGWLFAVIIAVVVASLAIVALTQLIDAIKAEDSTKVKDALPPLTMTSQTQVEDTTEADGISIGEDLSLNVADDAAAVGPLSPDVEYEMIVVGTKVDAKFRYLVDNEPVGGYFEEPTTLELDPGRHTISLEQTTTNLDVTISPAIAVYVLDAPPSSDYVVLLDSVNSDTGIEGWEVAVRQYDLLVESHPNLKLLPGDPNVELEPGFWHLFVPGFSSESQASKYCADAGLEIPDSCFPKTTTKDSGPGDATTTTKGPGDATTTTKG